jgi:hypothetical protein
MKGYALPAAENKMDGQDLMNPRLNLEHSSHDGWPRLNHVNRYALLDPGH